MSEANVAAETAINLADLPPLDDHAIYIFLQVDGPKTSWDKVNLNIAELVPAPVTKDNTGRWIPPAVAGTLIERYGAKSVWTTRTIKAGNDLHSHLTKLVCGNEKTLATLWSPSEPIKTLLKDADIHPFTAPKDARPTRQLIWTPSKSAYRRMAASGITEPALVYAVVVKELLLYRFRTEFTFLQAEVQIVPLTAGPLTKLPRKLFAIEFQEAAVALSRSGELGWQVPGEAPDKIPPFYFGTILRNLAGGAAVPNKSVERLFTLCYAQFAEPVRPDDADRYALYLARHYTTDYKLRDDATNVEKVRDFDTVGHVITLEGAATVVAPDHQSGELPDFLDRYGTGTLKLHYVPIALLAQHEHAFLVHATTESNFWMSIDEPDLSLLKRRPWWAYPPSKIPDAPVRPGEPAKRQLKEDVSQLEKLRRDSLKFRLAFRFSQVSMISMHNAVNRGFRQAMSLDRMLGELSLDVAEANEFLDQTREDRRKTREEVFEGRFFHYGRILAAIVIGIGVFQVADLLSGFPKPAIFASKCTAFAVLLVFLYQTWADRKRLERLREGAK